MIQPYRPMPPQLHAPRPPASGAGHARALAAPTPTHRGPFDGLVDMYFSIHAPLVALGGAGAGALIARLAGRAASTGGAVGAIIGGAAISAYMLGGHVLHNLGHLRGDDSPDWSPARVFWHGMAIGGVGGGAWLGSLVGGPVGAIVGAVVGTLTPFVAFIVASAIGNRL